jgi:hypothetical protein
MRRALRGLARRALRPEPGGAWTARFVIATALLFSAAAAVFARIRSAG